jgi:ribosome modulation factor
LLASLVLAAAASSPAHADVVHLKNGGTIACDSIEERGPDLVLKQGKGVIVVPRTDVLRIEKTSPVAAHAPPPPAGSPSIDELKRRIEANPLAGAENRRQLVVLLATQGEKALDARQGDEARRLFQDALQYDPKNLRSRRGLAAAWILSGQPAMAESTARQGLLDAPNDADLNLLLGEALLRLDRTADAIAALEKSQEIRPSAPLHEHIETLRRQQSVDGGYKRSEAARFTVSWDGERTAPALEAEILAFLEVQYPELALLFDYDPPDPIPVIVYPAQDFYAATQADRDVAGLFDGKVRVPIGGLKRLDPEARTVLRHELAHAFIAGKSRNVCPRWLHEGLAQWVEGSRTSRTATKSLARQYQDEGARFPGTFTYATALSFVEFLEERHGQAALNEALAEMGRGTGPDAALEKVLRFSLADLHTAWGDDLVRRTSF